MGPGEKLVAEMIYPGLVKDVQEALKGKPMRTIMRVRKEEDGDVGIMSTDIRTPTPASRQGRYNIKPNR